VTLQIIAVTPALGVVEQDVTIEILGLEFLPSSTVRLVVPAIPPVTFPFAGVTYVDTSTLRVLIPANALGIGYYDVIVDNGVGVTTTLPQAYRAAPDLIDPYAGQTLTVLQQRVRSRFSNAPNGKPYDLRIGSVVSDIVDSPLPEFEILYDRLARILKQGFAQYMGGAYLDLRCEEHGVIRRPATYADGIMQTTAPVGTVLPVGMTFSTTSKPNIGAASVSFTSTETAPKTQKATVTGTATSGTATSLTDTTKNFVTNEWANFYIWITAGTGTGQVMKVLTNTQTVINIQSWEAQQIPDATSKYSLFSGVDVQADLPGPGGNAAAGAVNIMTSHTQFVQAVTNPIAYLGGYNPETDAQLLARFLLTVRSPSSGGNVSDYIRWAQQVPNTEVGYVSVIPLWNGNGTVKVVIMNADGTVPNAATVLAVQNYLDPNAAGMGGGIAPIGAQVTVAAATTAGVDVSVKLYVTPGFNAATIASEVQASISNYMYDLNVGDTVLFTQIQHEILYDPAEPAYYRAGVQDYDILSAGHGIKLSTSGTWTQANITIPGTEKAIPGTITVTT
jgi:uncharacterized phage protein gp47/JayE